MTHSLLPRLLDYCQQLDYNSLDPQRQIILDPLIDFIRHHFGQSNKVTLNFICTHNSRRSQFAQIWAQTASAYFAVPVVCHSGGVEVTEFNDRAVNAIKQAGFVTAKQGNENPHYQVRFDENSEPVEMYSKLFDSVQPSARKYAAVMTCDHADQNCPIIPSALARIPVLYEDPKRFDGTSRESEAYAERCKQIASEMFYVFSKI